MAHVVETGVEYNLASLSPRGFKRGTYARDEGAVEGWVREVGGVLLKSEGGLPGTRVRLVLHPPFQQGVE